MSDHTKRTFVASLVGALIPVLLAGAGFVYGYGHLVERVDAVQQRLEQHTANDQVHFNYRQSSNDFVPRKEWKQWTDIVTKELQRLNQNIETLNQTQRRQN